MIGKPPKLVRFARLGAARLVLLAEAVAALAMARLIVATRSPGRLVLRLGVPQECGDDHRSVADARARDIAWSVRCAAANVPFRALCFEQALAIRTLLDRRAIPATVHYGVAPQAGDSDGLRAHVWTEAAGEPLTGYPLRPAFREIARFASARLKDKDAVIG